MSADPGATVAADAREETYRQVVEAVRGWEPNADADFTSKQQLAIHLEEALGVADAVDPAHDVAVGGAGQPHDVVVDDAIAVVVRRNFGPGTMPEFARIVGQIAEVREYLVVYGYDLPARDLDRWRMGKARYTASRSNLRDVSYVSYSPGEPEPPGGWPSALWHYAEPLMALLAIVIGLEIAVILQVQFGGFTPIMGPAATLITSLVLLALLVLLYQRTEL